MSFTKSGIGILVVAVLVAWASLGPIGDARAGDADALCEALEKAAGGAEDVPTLAKAFVPTVKAASKEAKEGIKDLLQEKYNVAKMTLEEAEMAKIARMTCILALAAKEAGDTTVHGNARMVLWQELFDTAGSATMDMEEKIQEGEKLAKLWEPLWEDLFLTVMKEHGVQEAKGDEAAMKQYLDQMEIMAKGWQKAFGKDDLIKKFDGFKKALEKWKRLSSEHEDLKRRAEGKFNNQREKAEQAFERAQVHFAYRKFEAALDKLEGIVIPNFSRVPFHDMLLDAHLLAVGILEIRGEWKRIGLYIQILNTQYPFVRDPKLKARWKKAIQDLEKRHPKKGD